MKWRLSNGQSINVWKDYWLKSTNNALISTATPMGLEHLKVGDLIDHTTQSWKLETINTIFGHEDIKAIKATPLLNPTQADKLIWKLTPQGTYIVRSAYHVLMDSTRELITLW